jgi:hypothetical protein
MREIERFCSFQGEARFADAARPDKRQQSAGGVAQQGSDFGKFAFSAYETCWAVHGVKGLPPQPDKFRLG